MEGLGIKMFNKIRKVLNEQKVDPKDIDAFLKAAIDNESPTNIKFRFEKIIRTLGFDKSLLKVNTLGWAKVIAYYADAQEAKKKAMEILDSLNDPVCKMEKKIVSIDTKKWKD